MQGRRVYPNEKDILFLSEGEYGYNPRVKHWEARPPGHHQGDLRNHKVTEHSDGSITVSPSILITSMFKGKQIQYHGYLERGIWRET